MNLSQSLKDAIARAIVADIPKPSHKQLVEEMQAALYAAMPADERRVYRKNPGALNGYSAHGSDYGFDHQVTLRAGSVKAADVLKPWYDQAKERREMRTKLDAAFKTVRTRKQFVDRFPEFIKYAPNEHGTCATLPAVANVVADLLKLGWTTKVSKG